MALTFLRHGSNACIVALAALLVALAAAHVVALPPLWLIAGALLFGATEYTTHRFVLHAKPATSPHILRLQERLHYDHHLAPERLDLLFLPPWFLFPLLAVFVALYEAIARDWNIVAAIVLGNLAGLLYYEWVHYLAHIPYKPKTPWGRYMKKYHLWHHFKNERMWFGVTNPSMDYVYRTYAKVDEVERSGSTRILFR